MRTARILSLVVLAVGAAGALVVSGWIVWAEDSPPPGGSTWEGTEPPRVEGLSQQAARAAMEPFWQQARQAQADSQWDLAARRFTDIGARLPEGNLKQNALLQAGNCLAHAGRMQEAIAKYDEVVALGSRLLQGSPGEAEAVSHRKHLPGHVVTGIKDNLWGALYGTVLACHEAGHDQEARQAIQSMRAWFPAFNNLKKVLPIAAQIEGQDAQRLLADEAAAETLVQQAKAARRAGQTDQAIQWADEVLSRYPETAAAWAATNAKAEILWLRGRYEDARTLYGQLRDALAPIAPDSPLAREAQWHCAFLDFTDLAKKLIVRGRDKNPTEADWQHAHELCGVVVRWASDDCLRAETARYQGELHYWQEQYPEALGVFDSVIRVWEPRIARQQGKDGIRLKNIVMMAHQFAGFSHLKSGGLDEAIRHLTTVVDACKDDPNAVHGKNAIAAGACLGLWQAYSLQGARDGMLSAETLMRDRWPDSDPARYLKFAKARMGAGQ